MPIPFKAPLSSEVANNTFLDKTIDDLKKGKLGLYKVDVGEADAIADVQNFLNEQADASGVTGENDPNSKTYSSHEIISDGDNRKVAIGKLDAQAKTNLDTNDSQDVIIADHEIRIVANKLLLDNHEIRIGDNETKIATIENDYGVPDGLATLDSSGEVPVSQLPQQAFDGLKPAGSWDADTNTPDLSLLTPNSGEYYVVTVAGSTSLGGVTTWELNDWAIFTASGWVRNISTAVTTVNGQKGAVILTKTDVGLANVTDDAQLKRTANDLNTFTEKVTPVEDDIVIIEDSEDSFNKKKVKLANMLGSGGGGGGSTAWIDGDIAPLDGFQNGLETKDFDFESGHEMFLNVIVPESYTVGDQIKLLNSKYFINIGTDNTYFRCETTLFKTGEDVTTDVNSHLSTNTENSNFIANTIMNIGEIDLSSAIGEINSVAIAIGDLLKVRLFRDFDNEFSVAQEDAHFLKFSSTVSFQG